MDDDDHPNWHIPIMSPANLSYFGDKLECPFKQMYASRLEMAQRLDSAWLSANWETQSSRRQYLLWQRPTASKLTNDL